MMEWVLVIFLWHSDAMTSQIVPMSDQKVCEAAAAEVRNRLAQDHYIVRAWTACLRRSETRGSK